MNLRRILTAKHVAEMLNEIRELRAPKKTKRKSGKAEKVQMTWRKYARR